MMVRRRSTNREDTQLIDNIQAFEDSNFNLGLFKYLTIEKLQDYNYMYVPTSSIEIPELDNQIHEFNSYSDYASTMNGIQGLQFLNLDCFANSMKKQMFSYRNSPIKSSFSLNKYRIELNEITTFNLSIPLEELYEDQLLPCLMDITEDMINFLLKTTVDTLKQSKCLRRSKQEQIEKLIQFKYVRISYLDALHILGLSTDSYKILNDKEYQQIVQYFGGTPVFIQKLPLFISDFNCLLDTRSSFSNSFELIFPEVGPIFFGKICDNSAIKMCEKIGRSNISCLVLSQKLEANKIRKKYVDKISSKPMINRGSVQFVFDKLFYLLNLGGHVSRQDENPKITNIAEVQR